jgi:predicted  nucleic acid-binding Zn-ribbon protein
MRVMPDSALAILYKLHKVDSALHGIRMRANALDAGKEDSEKLKAYMKETDSIRAAAKSASTKARDFESKTEETKEKKARFEEKLFSGELTNAREVENVQKEVAMLGDILETIAANAKEHAQGLPELKKKAKECEDEISVLQKMIVKKRQIAVAAHERLKAEYQVQVKLRPGASSLVPPALLNQYENIRKHHGDSAMAVITEEQTCGACGMHVPEKAKVLVNADRLAACEACRRILFAPVPDA